MSHVVGTDVFKFFASHSVSPLKRDFKVRVKDTLKNGQAITMELRLSTMRYIGYELFSVYFTPLKDDKGEVCWIMITLGSEMGW